MSLIWKCGVCGRRHFGKCPVSAFMLGMVRALAELAKSANEQRKTEEPT